MVLSVVTFIPAFPAKELNAQDPDHTNHRPSPLVEHPGPHKNPPSGWLNHVLSISFHLVICLSQQPQESSLESEGWVAQGWERVPLGRAPEAIIMHTPLRWVAEGFSDPQVSAELSPARWLAQEINIFFSPVLCFCFPF